MTERRNTPTTLKKFSWIFFGLSWLSTLGSQAQWEPIFVDSISNWTGLSFINDSTGFSCANFLTEDLEQPNRSLVFKSTDFGVSWNDTILHMQDFYPFDILEAPQLEDVYFISNDLGWVCGAMPYILRTEDGGDNWTQVEIEYNSITRIRFFNETHGIALGPFGTLQTLDSGQSWTVTPDNVWGTDVSFVGQCSPVISGSAGIDFGISCDEWEEVNFDLADGSPQRLAHQIQCLDGDNWIVACNGQGGLETNNFVSIVSTEDGGNEFTVLYDLYGISSPSDLKIDEDGYGWILANNAEGFDFQHYFFKTIDFGNSWYGQEYIAPSGMDVFGFGDLEFFSTDIAYCKTQNDQGSWVMRTLNSGGELIDLTTTGHDGSPDHPILLYPNPAGDEITILSQGRIAELRIVDTMGRNVFATENINDVQMSVGLTDLIRGTYFIIVKTERGSFVRAFVKR